MQLSEYPKLEAVVNETMEINGFDDYMNILIIFLEEFFNPESKFKPYFDILPRQLLTLAFKYWDRSKVIEKEIGQFPINSNLFTEEES